MSKPTTERFDIKNRFSGEVQLSVEIECAPDALPSLKLGLAVKAAFKAGANLTGANLARANLDGANLTGANLARAYLDGANLDGANLDGANLAWANLAGANLARANLDGANLDGANLTGAYLARAYLAGANLDGANLARANLDGANLARANLDGAYLAGANLDGANLDGKKIAGLAGRVTRNDGYEFIMWRFEDGSHVIRAGCRTFTADQYRDHVSAEYPDTDKAAETRAIIAFLEQRLAQTSPAVAAVEAA